MDECAPRKARRITSRGIREERHLSGRGEQQVASILGPAADSVDDHNKDYALVALLETMKILGVNVGAVAEDKYPQQTDRNAIKGTIRQDASGGTLLVVLDEYAQHLAFGSDAGGRPLSKNTVASNFGDVNKYYLNRFEPLRALCRRKLLKMASTTDNL
ncbi:hypothetical protein PybrP1_010437 [[Pythium] brassicae (nom. inval.)]|nr:hypothetical protein PybrP1_010437 [[Pythium] brassicae (nom. inval.)]